MIITIDIPERLDNNDKTQALYQASLFIQRTADMAPDIVYGGVTVGDTTIEIRKSPHSPHSPDLKGVEI